MEICQDPNGIDENEMDDHRAWRYTIAHIDLDVSDQAYWLGLNHIRM